MKVKKIIEHRHFMKDDIRSLCEQSGWMRKGKVLNRYDRLFNLLCRGDVEITNLRIFKAAELIVKFSHDDTVDSIAHVMEKILRCGHVTFEVLYADEQGVSSADE